MRTLRRRGSQIARHGEREASREDPRVESLAIVLPAQETRFDGQRRDTLLTAHAAQLARACAKRSRVRVFATSEFDAHDLFARLGAFRPTHVLIEHTALAYRDAAEPLAVASWGRAHAVRVTVVAHGEFARSWDPPESAIASGLAAAGPLLAQAGRIVCYETSWARVIGERFRNLVDHLEVVDPWPVLEPRSVVPVDASAPRLALVDDVAPRTLASLLDALREDGEPYRCAALFGAVLPNEPNAKVENVETGVELARAIADASLVVIPECRHETETQRWVRTALAFGRRVIVVRADGAIEQIERPAETTWPAIAHTLLRGEDRALAASLEEDVE